MTRFKFFTYLMPLASAGGLALGLAAAPAMADPPPHNHGGDGEPATTFAVSLNILTSSNPSSSATQCNGTTDIQANTGLQANFSPGQDCTVSVAIDEKFGLGSVLDLSLFSLEVKTKKSGTNLRLYFTTQLSWAPHTNPLGSEAIYVTDRLVAFQTFIDAPNDFLLTPIGADALALTKLHQPERGAVTAEAIAVGPFHYIADVP